MRIDTGPVSRVQPETGPGSMLHILHLFLPVSENATDIDMTQFQNVDLFLRQICNFQS